MTEMIVRPERESLERYLPQNVRDLGWVANQVAAAGIYKVGGRAMSGNEALIVMLKGAELGLTPMQSLNEISFIKGKPFVSKDVLTARITRSRRCTAWDPSDMDDKHCRIVFGVRRTAAQGDDLHELTTLIEDIPQRYFAPSSSGEPSNWTLIPEDMLFAWTVRRIARRWFPEALLDIGDSRADQIDESRVVNVAAVEREVGRSEFGQHGGPPKGATPDSPACGGTLYLHANQQGGAFLRCDKCDETFPPPQDVRDTIRGTSGAEPQLEPGERAPTPEELASLAQEEVRPSESGRDPGRSDRVAPPVADEGAVAAAGGDPATAPPVDTEAGAESEENLSAPVEEAPPPDFTSTWRENARASIVMHLRGRTAAGTAEEKAAIREALLAAHCPATDPPLAYVREKASDDDLSVLLDAFMLSVSLVP